MTKPIPHIKLDHVAAAVGGHTVVRDVSFEVPAGAKMALVGTNGAGKSTLLRAMAGINPAVEGRVSFDDVDIASLPAKKRARIVAFVSQEETPPADLRLGEMVALGRIPHRPPWAINDAEKDIVLESLETVGLGDYIHASCDRLSGGERRRAMLARGLAQNCPVLMLDEPTNHLDIAWTLKLLKLLSGLPITVVAAIHDLDVVLRNFDLVGVLHEEKLWAFGHPQEVINPQLMAEAFGVEALQTAHPHTHDPHLLISNTKGIG